ncbi:hypothetical protein LCGC14_1703510, partial [marine sediment metagenome]
MQRSVIFGFCAILGGCSTIGFGDLFTDYATQMTPVRQAINSNNMAQAQQLLPTNGQSHSNYLLNQLE